MLDSTDCARLNTEQMGIVLGIEAAVGIAEAVEAAAEVSDAIASAAEAGEAISTGAEAGSEAGVAAGNDAAAAVESGGDALGPSLETLNSAVAKIGKFVLEFATINAVFKVAKMILEALTEDPSAIAQARKLDKLIKVLNESSNLLQELTDWLDKHSRDTTNINDITVTIQGVLSKFIPQLGAAAKILQHLSDQISLKNQKNEPVTSGEVEAIEHSLQTVLDSFKSLADFKAEHQGKVPDLSGLPIDQSKVAELQAQMP